MPVGRSLGEGNIEGKGIYEAFRYRSLLRSLEDGNNKQKTFGDLGLGMVPA